jgi:PAS domain S-box-containing protein
MDDALSGTREYDLQYRIRLPGGSEKVIHAQAEVLRNKDGKPVTMRGTVQDITEYKRAEDAVRTSEERLRLLGDNLPNSMVYQYTHEPDGTHRFLYVSAGIERLNGVKAEDVLKDAGVLYSQLLPGELPALLEAERVSARELSVFEREVQMLLPDGQLRWMHLISRPRRLADGRTIWDGVQSDVTERKQAEKEKAKLKRQLLLAQKLESLGQLAGGIAHDFNNLLTVINGYGDLLLRKLKPGDPLREQVAEIRRAGEQGAALTKQLLAFSREEMIEPKPLGVNDLLHGSQAMLQRLLGEDVQVEIVFDPALGLVMADPGRLHQVLMNLAANSRDAMPRGGKFTISTANVNIGDADVSGTPGLKPGPFVLLQVSDTGTGIPKAIQERIFDPFFTTKAHGKGTGLGLATVYGIVRQSGGAISVCSEPGQGATFNIYLPRVEVRVLEGAGALASPEALRGIETILVVEDRPEVRRLVVDALQGSGYQILEAAAGSEALQVAERHPGPIHLLLTDVVMPHMTGKELAERLKQLRPETKMLYMSGYAADVISNRGLLNSGEHYIAKPFFPDSLLAKVREILGPSELRSGAPNPPLNTIYADF